MAFSSDSRRGRELMCGGIKNEVTVDMVASKTVVVIKNLMVECILGRKYLGE